jgi:hypothetical protein
MFCEGLLVMGYLGQMRAQRWGKLAKEKKVRE